MATYQILSWHGIPTGVRARDADGMANEKLAIRFQAAVDAAATEAGHVGTKDYLAGWDWSTEEEREGPAGEVAQVIVAELEKAYPPDRVKALRREIVERLNGQARGKEQGASGQAVCER